MLKKEKKNLCSGCFSSHFPQPNMRDCKYIKKQIKKTSFPIRLRGGAQSEDFSMIQRAMANAAAHDIEILPGTKTSGDGNCIFSSILDNINTREAFSQSYDGTADKWRNIWMTEVESKAYQEWNSGLSEIEWLEGWHMLKNSRTYECKLGDLILPGVAHCVKKDVLIFNTSSLAHSPVFVVKSSTLCGQIADTEIPICLAYNQVHYESLIPKTQDDVQKTIELKQQILNSNYTKTFQEIPFFSVEVSSQAVSYAAAVKKNIISGGNCSSKSNIPSKKKQYTAKEGGHISTPPRKRQKDSIQNNNSECVLSLEELKSIKAKERTPAQQKRYKHLLYLERKSKETESQATARKLQNRQTTKEMSKDEMEEYNAHRKNLKNMKVTVAILEDKEEDTEVIVDHKKNN